MSLVSIFVDAFKKAAGKHGLTRKEKLELARNSGGTLGSTDTPLRPTPQPDTGQGIDTGDVAETGEPDARASG